MVKQREKRKNKQHKHVRDAFAHFVKCEHEKKHKKDMKTIQT